MAKCIDLLGRRFGSLVVLKRHFAPNLDRAWWVCQCDCGNTKPIRASYLLNGTSTTCGCSHVTHGMSYPRTTEYNIWAGMKRRCSNPNDIVWRYYGGRGIRVCERWKDFSNFFADMGYRPSSDHSIDRIDPDGNYEPGNCRWATRVEQNNNTRRNKKRALS